MTLKNGEDNMERTLISEIFADPKSFDKVQVTVGGWIRTMRAQKTFGFIELNDGSYFKSLQVVFEDGIVENYKDIAKQNVGAALIVSGTLVYTPEAKQPIELKAAMISVEGASTPDYPLQKKRHTMEYLRTIAHLRPRTNTFSAVFRVRSVAAYAIHQFFQDRGFVYVHTPLITASDCEGAGEMFNVTTLDMANPPKTEDGEVDWSQDFFGKHASLTVSGQLNAESFAQAFGNVYTFGPTFRAENSNTQRHAAEFWMIEPEMAFADLNDYMDTAEAMIKFVISEVMKKCPQEMEFFGKFIDKELLPRLQHVMDSEFVRVSYTEAVELLEKSGAKFDYPVSWGCDLQTEHERYLTEQLFKKPVFVTDYPKEIKAFYMRLNDDGKTVAAADCLVPGIGEIIGGSQREERLDVLENRMQELGLSPEDYWWYLDLRRYGSTHHAGFGLGFERLIMYLTGISNIRDVLPHPRTVGNADF
jgi:asparaginyl-tRNA synthetase